MDEVKKGVIYSISHPISNEIVYIGQTLDYEKRKHMHGFFAKNKELSAWVTQLKNKGLFPKFSVIMECGVNYLLKEEKKQIETHITAGCKLFNIFVIKATKIVSDRPVGRPRIRLEIADRPVSSTVSITPNDRLYLEAKYGSLTNALRSLVKSKKK